MTSYRHVHNDSMLDILDSHDEEKLRNKFSPLKLGCNREIRQPSWPLSRSFQYSLVLDLDSSTCSLEETARLSPPTRVSLFVQKKKFFSSNINLAISIRPVSSVKFVFDKFRSDADDQSMRRPSIHTVPEVAHQLLAIFQKKTPHSIVPFTL